MIYIYWNRAVGMDGGMSDVFDFPSSPESLADIYMRIRNRDFSFLGDFYLKYGPEVCMKSGEVNDLLHQALILYGEKIISSMDRNEILIMEAWKFLKDLENLENRYKMHMQDWHQIYEPFARYRTGEKQLIKEIMGYRGGDPVFDGIRKNYESLVALRNSVEEFIKEKMEICCPNLSSVAGPVLGAELISIAGGLGNLAMMPGSRIQILGAGKAFFSSKKRSMPGPKHGVIFKHPYVHNSKERGKRARMLAGRIAIAARIDYFSGERNREFLEKSKNIF